MILATWAVYYFLCICKFVACWFHMRLGLMNIYTYVWGEKWRPHALTDSGRIWLKIDIFVFRFQDVENWMCLENHEVCCMYITNPELPTDGWFRLLFSNAFIPKHVSWLMHSYQRQSGCLAIWLAGEPGWWKFTLLDVDTVTVAYLQCYRLNERNSEVCSGCFFR